MTNQEAWDIVDSVYNTIYAEMTPEELFRALERLCLALKFLIERLPEEE